MPHRKIHLVDQYTGKYSLFARGGAAHVKNGDCVHVTTDHDENEFKELDRLARDNWLEPVYSHFDPHDGLHIYRLRKPVEPARKPVDETNGGCNHRPRRMRPSTLIDRGDRA